MVRGPNLAPADIVDCYYTLQEVECARLRWSAREAFDQLSTVQLVGSRLGETMVRTVSRPTPRVKAVLNGVGLTQRKTVC